MATLYEPITITENKKHTYFDRRIATQEGYRTNAKLRKDKVERPYLLARRWQDRYLFKKNDMYGKENLIIRAYEDKEKPLRKIIKRITAKNKLIDVADLEKHENLKDKTIFVYVEKYSDNIYTVREDRYRDSQVIAELYSEQFFGIAGEFMIINFDKTDNKYYFKRVISSYNYWEYKKKSGL